jgi:hypothetical protein
MSLNYISKPVQKSLIQSFFNKKKTVKITDKFNVPLIKDQDKVTLV